MNWGPAYQECQGHLHLYNGFTASQDREILFASPASQTDQVLEGLRTKHKAGSRCSVPTQMDGEPPMPELFTVTAENLAAELSGGEGPTVLLNRGEGWT